MENTTITNVWDPEKYLRAWNYASLMHEGQTYGGPEDGQQIDYLCHIGAVAMEVLTALQQTPEPLEADLAVQCALLHDTLEDTEATPEIIRDKFGPEVLQGVQALTKNESLGSKREQMEDSLRRIRQCPREVWMVKLADRICNLQEPPYYWDKSKMRKYAEEGEMILDALGAANAWLSSRLRQRIDNYARFYSA